MIIKIFYFHIWHISKICINLLADDPQFGYIIKLEKETKKGEKKNPETCFQVSINSNHHGCFWV
jgi:hypothetical protein